MTKLLLQMTGLIRDNGKSEFGEAGMAIRRCIQDIRIFVPAAIQAWHKSSPCPIHRDINIMNLPSVLLSQILDYSKLPGILFQDTQYLLIQWLSYQSSQPYWRGTLCYTLFADAVLLMYKSAPQLETNDWLDEFYNSGYIVIKNAIPKARAIAYQQRAFEWLNSFGTDLDLENPKTWVKENLPIQSKINTFHNYAVMHEKFIWEARQEPGVLEAFSKLWGTDELLVSFDSLNVTLPNRKDVPRKGAWQHVDQGPFRRGLQCVQGIINLSYAGPEDGGLVVYPGSHRLFEQFFDTTTDEATWSKKDLYLFSDSQLEWYGIQPYKVCAEPGDLIMWDSRLIHYGAEPTKNSNVIRTVIYASYTPASFATKEALATKAEIFRQWGGTTHWPHDNIVARERKAIREDGTIDPKDRSEPLNKPGMTDQLLRLAGLKAY